MSIFKFICQHCGFEFEKDSDGFYVSYGCVKETKCPNCGNEVINNK